MCAKKYTWIKPEKMFFSIRIGKSLLGFQPDISMQALRVLRNAADGSLKYSITT